MKFLAKSDISGLINIIIGLVVLVLLVVAKLAERWIKGYAERQAEEQQRRREASGQIAPQAQRQDESEERHEPAAPAQRAARPYPPIPLPETQRPEPVPIAPPPALAVPRPARRPLVKKSIAHGVEEETTHLQTRLSEQQRNRRRRLGTRPPEEADTAAIAARLVSIRPSRGAGVSDERQIRARVRLGDIDQARAAIIFHEIFSLPKGLRRQAEVWEM